MRVGILSFILLMFLGHAAAASESGGDIKFAFAPNNASAISAAELPIGTKLEFSSTDLKPDEILFLHRCGDPCTTAKEIRRWQGNKGKNIRDVVVIEEPGIYYFWILRMLPNGEVGPVFGKSLETKGTATDVHYGSGTEVSVVRLR